MSFAKLIDGQARFAPNPILIDGNYVGNPGADLLLREGYLPVVDTPYPEAPAAEGFRWVPVWTALDRSIAQSWVQEASPELDPAEALNLLLGGGEL